MNKVWLITGAGSGIGTGIAAGSNSELDGKPVDWLEQVSDEQYQAPNVNQ